MTLAQHADPNGLVYTASTADSAARFADLTSAYMGFRPETGAILQSLEAADPDMPMATCAKGYFTKLFGNQTTSAKAAEISAGLNDRLPGLAANDREKAHAAALTSWCAGDLDRTTQIWEDILLDHPGDGLALRLAHFTHFYSGDGRRMRDSLARVLPRWSKDHPDYGFAQGMYAFGLEEAREYDKAESWGRAAVDRNPRDAWSVHAVAHVLEMTERHEEGIAWVDGLEQDWSSVNNFRFHLHWHKCLYHLERGEFDAVLALYDRQIVSDISSGFYLDICNCSSLLWRLEMFGVPVGDRWQTLADVARNHVADTDLIFVSLHYLMALIAAGDRKASDEMIENLRAWSTLDQTQARICADVGIAIAEGMQLARTGAYADAVSRIAKVRYGLSAVGGSAAQRDVFFMIMLDAAKSGQDAVQARALFAERLGDKVHSSWTWKNYAGVLGNLGETEAAGQAADRARALVSA